MLIALAAVAYIPSGCARSVYDPDRATRPYAFDLHTTETVDMQVFRDGVNIEIVNATARSYRDFDLWINQRYVSHIDSLPAGETVQARVRKWQISWSHAPALPATAPPVVFTHA